MGLPAFYPMEKMKFSSSWGWIMKVVEKIGQPPIHPRTGKLMNFMPGDYPRKDMMFDIDDLNIFSPHIKVYRAAVNYVVWFNKQIQLQQ